MKINEKIKQLRLKNKMSQKELSQKLGISLSMLQKYEYGDYKIKNEIVIKICDIFNISIDDLLKNIEGNKEIDEVEKYYKILFSNTYEADKKLTNTLIDLDDRSVFLQKDEKAIIEFLLYNGFDFTFLDKSDVLLYCKNDKLNIDCLINIIQLRQLIFFTKNKIIMDFKMLFETFGNDWETEAILEMENEENPPVNEEDSE